MSGSGSCVCIGLAADSCAPRCGCQVATPPGKNSEKVQFLLICAVTSLHTEFSEFSPAQAVLAVTAGAGAAAAAAERGHGAGGRAGGARGGGGQDQSQQ